MSQLEETKGQLSSAVKDCPKVEEVSQEETTIMTIAEESIVDELRGTSS